MNWLISGGCGFIGTALIKVLAGQGGHAVRVLDNLSVGGRDDLALVAPFKELGADQATGPPAGVELVVGDIRDDKLALDVTRGCDVVVHLAANTGVAPSVKNPRGDCMTNVIGTFNILDAVRINRVPRFVFASSGAATGAVEPPIHEEMPAHPFSPYGAGKLAGEGYCSAYFRTYGIDTVALRFGNVYGPGSAHKSSVVAKFIHRILRGEALEIYGDGKQTRDFIYIDDLVDAVMLAATRPGIGGEVFQIATGMETTVGEMTERLVAIVKDAGIQNVAISNTAPQLGDVKRNYSDTTKARTRLGWSSKVSIDEGLRRTVNHFMNK